MKELTQEYLKIIGMRSVETVEDVSQMLKRHLELFPFNNLEILLNPGKILSLEERDIFEKIIVRKLGGYCFEHNKLIYIVLKTLGHDVSAKLARVVYGSQSDVPKTHRMSILKIAGEDYLIDAGFGGYSPEEALALNGKKKNLFLSPYWIEQVDGNLYHMNGEREGKRFTYYTFDLNRSTESDFNLANYYTNTHPESKFVKDLIVTKRTADGMVAILNDSFSRISKEGRVERQVADKNDLEYILKNDFGFYAEDAKRYRDLV